MLEGGTVDSKSCGIRKVISIRIFFLDILRIELLPEHPFDGL
jgi:hypothetical protein